MLSKIQTAGDIQRSLERASNLSAGFHKGAAASLVISVVGVGALLGGVGLTNILPDTAAALSTTLVAGAYATWGASLGVFACGVLSDVFESRAKKFMKTLDNRRKSEMDSAAAEISTDPSGPSPFRPS